MKRIKTIAITSIILSFIGYGAFLAVENLAITDTKKKLQISNRHFIVCATDTDTIVGDSSSASIIYMFKYSLKLEKQLTAAKDLIRSMNCANIPDSLDYYNYTVQRLSYFKTMGLDTAIIPSLKCY